MSSQRRLKIKKQEIKRKENVRIKKMLSDKPKDVDWIDYITDDNGKFQIDYGYYYRSKK